MEEIPSNDSSALSNPVSVTFTLPNKLVLRVNFHFEVKKNSSSHLQNLLREKKKTPALKNH